MGLTIGNLIAVLYSTNSGSAGSDLSQIPSWPADAFGVCAFILEASGTYDYVLRQEWLESTTLKAWQATVRETGDQWVAWQEDGGAPELVQEWWDVIWQNRDCELIKLPNYEVIETQIVDALVRIALVADETHAVLNLPELVNKSTYTNRIRKSFDSCNLAEAKQTVREFKDECLKNLKFDSNDYLSSSTLGRNLEASMVRVLPKKKSPEVGISLRSITQNIGIWTKNEVLPRWIEVGPSKINQKVNSALNILLVPWPKEVRPSQFDACEEVPGMPQVSIF